MALSRACFKSQLEVLMELSSQYDFEIFPENTGYEDLCLQIAYNIATGDDEPKNSKTASQSSPQVNLQRRLALIEEIKTVIRQHKANKRNSSLGKESPHKTTPTSISLRGSIQSPDVEGKIVKSDKPTTFYGEFEIISVEEIKEDHAASSGPSHEHQLPNHGPSGGGLLAKIKRKMGPRSHVV